MDKTFCYRLLAFNINYLVAFFSIISQINIKYVRCFPKFKMTTYVMCHVVLLEPEADQTKEQLVHSSHTAPNISFGH